MESWKLKRMCEKNPDELKVRLQKSRVRLESLPTVR